MIEKFNSKDIQKNLKKIQKHLPLLADLVNTLTQKKRRSPEEEEQLKETTALIIKLKQYVEDARLVLNDKLYRQTVAFYFHVKNLAEQGDKEAEKLYHELKPLYNVDLLDDLNDN